MNLLLDGTFSIGVRMDFSLIVIGLFTLIITTMKKEEISLNSITRAIGAGVLLGKSITPIVRKVIRGEFVIQ